MIWFQVPIAPVPKGRPRFWNGRVLTDRKTRAFEKAFAKAASAFRPAAPLKGALEIAMVFTIEKPKTVRRPFPSVRPDVDNYVKAVSDALKAFWVDDGQIVDLNAIKEYGERPGITVRIQEKSA